MRRAVVLAIALAMPASVVAQEPVKPSQVRPNLPGPKAKRSPGPMLDADNAKRGPDGVGALKTAKPTKGAKPSKAAEPASAEGVGAEPEAAKPDPRLAAARERIASRTPAHAKEIRARRAEMVSKALRNGEVGPDVKAAIERHVKRMAKLDRIEALAVAHDNGALTERVETARQEERVRHSLWLMKHGEQNRGAKR